MRSPERFLIVAAFFVLTGSALRPRLSRRVERRQMCEQVGAACFMSLMTFPEEARANVYTKEEFCRQSDEENANGIAPGCEDYVQDPAKKQRMRTRALAEVQLSEQELSDTAEITSARDGAMLRQRLRAGKLSSLRKDGKRLIALSTSSNDQNLQQADYAKAIAAIEQLDLSARKLELDEGEKALLIVNTNLDQAKSALRIFLERATSSSSSFTSSERTATS